jgi:hypothetical protein
MHRQGPPLFNHAVSSVASAPIIGQALSREMGAIESMDAATEPAGLARRRTLPFLGMTVAVCLLFGLLLRYVAHLQSGGAPTLDAYAEAMCRWDCRWYINIAVDGYGTGPRNALEGQADWAFFPLTPILLGLVHLVTGLAMPLAGMLMSLLATIAATLAAWPLLDGNRRAFVLVALQLLAGPASTYFAIGYSESLFLLFGMLAFVALKRGNYLGAGIAGILLSACRLVGLAAAMVVLLQAYLDHRRVGGTLASFPAAVLADGRLVLGIALAPLGLFAYMAFLYLQVGDVLAFARVQQGWNRVLDSPLSYFIEGFISGAPALLAWSVTALLGLLLIGLMALRRRWAEALFCALGLFVPMSGGLLSTTRFLLGLAPIHLLLGEVFSASRVLTVLAALTVLVLGYVTCLGWFADFEYLV